MYTDSFFLWNSAILFIPDKRFCVANNKVFVFSADETIKSIMKIIGEILICFEQD